MPGPLLARLCKCYEAVMCSTCPNLATEPHHLYLRIHTSPGAATTPSPPLLPVLHQDCTPPLGFMLHGVELHTCRARTPLSVLAPQHEHERVTSQTATRLWWAPVSVLCSWAPSRAVSRAVVHGLGTHVIHRL
ncbi:hypothetical protein PLESTF_001918000 [Pleodorina starrii]|nr:hypothetical protein PLESTF_001918000 [Pleodorina starrii]